MVRQRNQCPKCWCIGKTVYEFVDETDARFIVDCDQCNHLWLEVYDFRDIEEASDLEREIGLIHKPPEMIVAEDDFLSPVHSDNPSEIAVSRLMARFEANLMHFRELAGTPSRTAFANASPVLLRHIHATCAKHVFHACLNAANAERDSAIAARLASLFQLRREHYREGVARNPEGWGDVSVNDLRYFRLYYTSRAFHEARRIAQEESNRFNSIVSDCPTTCPKCDEPPRFVRYWVDELSAEFVVECPRCSEIWVEIYEYKEWREATEYDKESANKRWQRSSAQRVDQDAVEVPVGATSLLKHASSEDSSDRPKQSSKKTS